MPRVTPLAAFSRDWIGGDIRGLQDIAETLYAYLPRVQDLAGTLSVTVRDLTSDGPGGWQGKAADAFTADPSRCEDTCRPYRFLRKLDCQARSYPHVVFA